jgi:thiol:disulfide interchange protein
MLSTRFFSGLLASSLVLICSVVFTSPATAQQPTTYLKAYKKAQAGNKPLLVLVTADWCPPCQVMKSTTIPTLMRKQAFEQFNYATVDLDREEPLARQLIGDRGVPQLIMFEKQNDQWVRRYLRGIQTPETVEAFVAQANSPRTASMADAVVGK